MDTIDESVWDTLRRDLLAVWEKMRQVLWPKYLLGGMMNSGSGDAEGTLGQIRGLVGRWPDADAVLQGGMSEGLRDWDLWYVYRVGDEGGCFANVLCRGPLLFCLLLSFFLSLNARDDQRSLVFSGVFAMIWIAEAVVTLQIKLLGGNMYVCSRHYHWNELLTRLQLLLPIRLHHRLHPLPNGHCRSPQRSACASHRQDTRLHRTRSLVFSGRRQHSGWKWCGEEQGVTGGLPIVRLLHWRRLPLLHLVDFVAQSKLRIIEHVISLAPRGGLVFYLVSTSSGQR